MYLTLQSISKRFGRVRAVDDVSLGIDEREFLCILGPSGCGKTTLLRIVAGLEGADGGSITLDGHDLMAVPARERGFGIVFQSYSLFPNMTVAENIGYGLAVRKAPRAHMARRVEELLALVAMSDQAHRLPHELSGGQQQRVALARALAVDPRLLLLDEPLSALDAKVRAVLRDEIRDLQRRLGVPTLMVTHDQEEAMTMADRIVCMNRGRIEQVGSPEELYVKPHSAFVASFIGRMNFLPASGLDGRPLACANGGAGEGFGVRPERIQLESPQQGTAGSNHFLGKIARQVFLGNVTRLEVEVGDQRLMVEESGQSAWRAGERVSVFIPPAAIVALGDARDVGSTEE